MARLKKIMLAAAAVFSLVSCGQASPDIELSAVNVYENGGNSQSQEESSSVPESASLPEKSENVSVKVDVQRTFDSMNLKEKICQMIIATPESVANYYSFTYMDDWFKECYKNYPVGGFIYFSGNISYSDQLRQLLADTQELAQSEGAGVFQTVDEEGGSLTRVSYALGISPTKDMSSYGSLNDNWETYTAGATIGEYLADYGFNVDFAPVADVNLNPYNELGSRIFSSDPTVVSDMTSAFVRGLNSKGICSTLKHFPGLGAGGGNTHYGSVYIDRTYDQLKLAEFPAFKGGIDAGADFVMVGHQMVFAAEEADGQELPADLSPTVVTDWLRGELGFGGLVITDSHSMDSITGYYGSGEAAAMAVEAGCDIILMPYSLEDAVDGLISAVNSGRISFDRIDESVMKILQKKFDMGIL